MRSFVIMLRDLLPPRRGLFSGVFAVLLLGAGYALDTTVNAYVASSTSYRIQTDSINTGGILSTSTSYGVEDTLGESGVGTSSSVTFNIKAGYQQMRQTYLAISVPGNVTLLPNIPASGGVADGNASWTVTTDNIAGYTMSIAASTSPALVSGANNFANYTPSGADPDFAWSIAATTAEFGFTPEGTDVVQRFRDNGAACNAGSGETAGACWAPVTSVGQTVASSAAGNHPGGVVTTLRFKAESGTSNVQPAGVYSSVATITIIAN